MIPKDIKDMQLKLTLNTTTTFNSTCYSDLAAVPLWGQWWALGLGTGLASNILPQDLLIFWALICSSCAPFSSLMGPMHPRCIGLNGWIDSHLAKRLRKSNSEMRGKRTVKRLKKNNKMQGCHQTWMHSAFLSLKWCLNKLIYKTTVRSLKLFYQCCHSQQTDSLTE